MSRPHGQSAGDKSEQYVVNFEEKSGPDPIGDMLMKVCIPTLHKMFPAAHCVCCTTHASQREKACACIQGMLSNASPEVRKQLGQDS